MNPHHVHVCILRMYVFYKQRVSGYLMDVNFWFNMYNNCSAVKSDDVKENWQGLWVG